MMGMARGRSFAESGGGLAMAVKVADVAVGKCYATHSGEVRHVLEIAFGQIVYEARGKKPTSRPWDARIPVSIIDFVAALSREVPCDQEIV
jgi:hypothetical protein